MARISRYALILLFFLALQVTNGKSTTSHHELKKKSKPARRFDIPNASYQMEMPTLNDDEPEIHLYKPTRNFHDSELPGAYGEDNPEDFESNDESGSSSGEEPAEKRSTTRKPSRHPHKPETAARFGNNWKLAPGINPHAAFVPKVENHKGFRGRDKDVRQSKKKLKTNKVGKQVKTKKRKNDNRTKDEKLTEYLKDASAQKNNTEKSTDGDTDDTDDGSSDHNEDADIIRQIKNIAAEIDKVEQKRKEEDKETHKSGKEKSNVTKTNTTPVNNVLNTSQCPWSCFWTCQSYCPKECCYNPYNCSSDCREICTPYCKDVCCAPGAKRLPKLQIRLSTANAEHSDVIKKPRMSPEILTKIKALKAASDYAVKLLGVPKSSCPAFCPKVCVPTLCNPECCQRGNVQYHPLRQQVPPSAGSSLQQPQIQQNNMYQHPQQQQNIYQQPQQQQNQLYERNVFKSYSTQNNFPLSQEQQQQQQQQQTSFNRREDFLKRYPTMPLNPLANFTNVQNFNQPPMLRNIAPPVPHSISAPVRPPVLCHTQENCPPGGVVDPNFCPPICRSSCIDQCPNECCQRG